MRIESRAHGATHVGQLRTSNQDSFLIEQDQLLYIVADGMGGHAGGEIASQLCVKEIASYCRDNLQKPKPDVRHPDPRINKGLVEAVNFASTRIYERALEDPSLKGMGTTATLIKIVDDHAYCAHVGDSRLYLLRAGFLYQLSADHSLVSEQVRAGILTKEEAELHHLRNVITRSVGYQEEEDVDTLQVQLENNDLLILCSDGLHGKVTDTEIADLTGRLGHDAVEQLIALANERGGDDNITVVIVKIKVLD